MSRSSRRPAWWAWRVPVEPREPLGSLVGHRTDSSLYFEGAGSYWEF